MKQEIVKLDQIEVNSSNPRSITDNKFKKLISSILIFPKMLDIRPIVVDNTMVALGGNMRYRALVSIADMDINEVHSNLEQQRSYRDKTKAEKEALLDYWAKWLDNPTATIIKASELTDSQKSEFIIKDNVGFGDWDMDMLANEWDEQELEEWGMDVWQPNNTSGDKEDNSKNNISETQKLSNLEFTGMYYEPKEKPELELQDCYDLTKYNAKISVIEESDLSPMQKEVMKIFAYRFIKINFEAVANYYAFNATEEEQRVIERLRMVLVDGSIDGFIEDDLIKIREDVMQTDLDWQTQKISGYDYE